MNEIPFWLIQEIDNAFRPMGYNGDALTAGFDYNQNGQVEPEEQLNYHYETGTWDDELSRFLTSNRPAFESQGLFRHYYDFVDRYGQDRLHPTNRLHEAVFAELREGALAEDDLAELYSRIMDTYYYSANLIEQRGPLTNLQAGQAIYLSMRQTGISFGDTPSQLFSQNMLHSTNERASSTLDCDTSSLLAHGIAYALGYQLDMFEVTSSYTGHVMIGVMENGERVYLDFGDIIFREDYLHVFDIGQNSIQLGYLDEPLDDWRWLSTIYFAIGSATENEVQARDHYRTALRLNPNDVLSRHNLAVSFILDHYLAQGQQIFEDLQNRGLSGFRALRLQAFLAEEQGNYEQAWQYLTSAIELIQRVINLNPDSFPKETLEILRSLYEDRVRVRSTHPDDSEQIAIINQMLTIGEHDYTFILPWEMQTAIDEQLFLARHLPENSFVQLRLADLYSRAENYESAVHHLEQARENAQFDFPLLQTITALIAIRMNDYNQARQSLESLSLSPYDVTSFVPYIMHEVYFNLIFRGRGQGLTSYPLYQDLINFAQTNIENRIFDFWSAMYLGCFYFYGQNYEASLAAFEEAQQRNLDEDPLVIDLLLGYVHLALGNAEEALSYFDHIDQYNENFFIDPEIDNGLWRAHELRGDLESTRYYYEQSIEDYPDDYLPSLPDISILYTAFDAQPRL